MFYTMPLVIDETLEIQPELHIGDDMKTTLAYRMTEDEYLAMQNITGGYGVSTLICKKLEEYVDNNVAPETRQAKTRSSTLSMEIELALKLKNYCTGRDIPMSELVDAAVKDIISANDLTTTHTPEI